jgi:hypothetical protein
VAEKRRGPKRAPPRRKPRSQPRPRPSLAFLPHPEAVQGLKALLASYRKRFETGDRQALVQAIELCLACRIVPEDWIATNGSACFRAWFGYDRATLDEAFGVERKGEHFPRQHKKERLRPLILFRLYALHHLEGAPIGKTTFETVPKEFGVSGSYVNDLVYKDRKGRALAKLLHDWPIVSLAKLPETPKATRARN